MELLALVGLRGRWNIGQMTWRNAVLIRLDQSTFQGQ